MPSRHAVLDRTRRVVFAHRGGAGLQPENTIAAFDRGLELGADGLELDVQLSRDGEVVVMHDFTVDRTTDGEGPVASQTWRTLSSLDAAHRFEVAGRHPLRGSGVGVPRLRDVLARYPQVPLIVELKGASRELAEAAVHEVRAADAVGRVCFGSFEDVTIQAVRRRGDDLVTSGAREEIRRALWASWLGLPPLRPRFQALQVPERLGDRRVATRRFISAANRGGITVQVWIVNEITAMTRLLSWGVQGIITDRPDLAVPTVRNFNNRQPRTARQG